MSATCNDCGFDYDGDQDQHLEFCEARTCVMCQATFNQVLHQDPLGNRVCGLCQLAEGTDAAAYYNSEEEDEDGLT
jgi:hypothetical protein